MTRIGWTAPVQGTPEIYRLDYEGLSIPIPGDKTEIEIHFDPRSVQVKLCAVYPFGESVEVPLWIGFQVRVEWTFQGIIVYFNTTAGRAYSIERTLNLLAQDWQEIDSGVGDGTVMAVGGGDEEVCFFRGWELI